MWHSGYIQLAHPNHREFWNRKRRWKSSMKILSKVCIPLWPKQGSSLRQFVPQVSHVRRFSFSALLLRDYGFLPHLHASICPEIFSGCVGDPFWNLVLPLWQGKYDEMNGPIVCMSHALSEYDMHLLFLYNPSSQSIPQAQHYNILVPFSSQSATANYAVFLRNIYATRFSCNKHAFKPDLWWQYFD